MLGKIGIVHPGAPGDLKLSGPDRDLSGRPQAPTVPHVHGGNVSTALRWATIFERLGWSVQEGLSWEGAELDVLVALHARKSHASIMRFKRAHPDKPVVVAATGTDIYGDAPACSVVRESFEIATRIVVLQPLAIEALPETERAKARVIYQSMPHVTQRASSSWNKGKTFNVAFLANARRVKDPLTALRAAQQLPRGSRVRIQHLGGTLDEALGKELQQGAKDCPAFTSLGALPREEALRILEHSEVALSTSRHEGGANVVTEALAYCVPVIASDIPGSVGLLGEGYPGLFPVGDARALAALLDRCATNEAFYGTLFDACRSLASITDPEREFDSWKELLGEL